METRKVRTPSARLLAAKQDEVAFEKLNQSAPAAPPPLAATPKAPAAPPTAVMSTLNAQLARASGPPSSQTPVATQAQINQIVQSITRQHPPQDAPPPQPLPPLPRSASMEKVDEDTVTRQPAHHMDDDIDVDTSEALLEDVDDGDDDEMELKQEKMDAQMVMNGDFSVANEVTISSMKYQGRPPQTRKVVHYVGDDHIPMKLPHQRHSNFTGETLNLKSSDLSIPNKAAHFLYFRCYEEHEVQKEFPLTIDEHRKGPQNFLVEPRVGLKNTDYYIDSYLWNRGKSTSSKKKIFVEIEGNHVKTSRRACESAHYVLNWYYSNMEQRICKKVCWLETVSDCVRASPVLVQYHVNYLSDNPIELRKTPKLYSDTRSVAQELLRSDSPLQTVQRFVETGETDPREIINKKQAYEMRRYVMANARKRGQNRKYDDMYYDDEMYEEIYYNEHGEPIPVRNTPRESQSDLGRVASMAVRMEGRKIEHRIARMLDSRLGPTKNHAELVSEWVHSLEAITPDDAELVIHSVIGSMRKHLDEMLGEPHHPTEYMVETPSTSGGHKRLKMMDDDDEEEDDVRHLGGRRRNTQKRGEFDGSDRFMFEGQEYVEEEVITEEIEEVEEVVATTSGHPDGEQTTEPETAYFFEGASTSNGPGSSSGGGPSGSGDVGSGSGRGGGQKDSNQQ